MARFRTLLPMAILVAAPCAVTAQITNVEAVGDRIIVTDRWGENSEIVDPGLVAKSVRVSPNKLKLVYYTAFAGQRDPQAPLKLKVWSLDQSESPQVIRLPTRARYIERVEWIDSRYVLIAGDGKGLVVDTELGGATHSLWASRLGGMLFFLSPDREKIIYGKGTSRGVPLDYITDVVMVAVVGRGLAPTQESLGLEAGAQAVYPPADEPNSKGTPAAVPEDRHRLRSGFLWFSGSSRVAFVEEHRGTLWLVVLTLRIAEGRVSAHHEQLSLDAEPGVVSSFSWVTPGYELEVTVNGKRLLVKPLQGVGQGAG